VTSEELIQHFVKLVAAGGGMTLNVGPAADGQIPLLQQERLLDLGQWLEINGEAIYGSRPYDKFYEMSNYSMYRVDSTIDFDWVRNAPYKSITYDHFTVNWTGLLTPPVSGEYTFEAEADDFMTLLINGKVVFSNKDSLIANSDSNVQEANTSKSLTGKINLEKDQHYVIEVLYEEQTHQATARLFWSYPGQTKTIVPSSAVMPKTKVGERNGLGEKGLMGFYHCYKPTVAYTSKPGKLYAIALKFPDRKLVLTIPKPKKGTEIYLLGSSEKSLPWKHKNGQLIIDTSDIRYSEIKSKGAWSFVISL